MRDDQEYARSNRDVARLRARHARLRPDRSRDAAFDVDSAHSMSIERGTLADFQALAASHYRRNAPGTVVAVYVARVRGRAWMQGSDVVRRFGRLHERSDAASSRLSISSQSRPRPSRAIGVLVLSMPVLNGALRDVATGGRYVGLTPRERASFVNREVRAISRVVVDPRCRGLGVATHLVRHALDHARTVYTEAWASMGRVSPFFARAGMVRYDGPPTPAQSRLRDAMAELDLDPCDLARPDRVLKRLRRASPHEQAWFDAELRRFIRFGRAWIRPGACKGKGEVEGEGVDVGNRISEATRRAWMNDAWRAAWQRPVYYLAHREQEGRRPEANGRHANSMASEEVGFETGS